MGGTRQRGVAARRIHRQRERERERGVSLDHIIDKGEREKRGRGRVRIKLIIRILIKKKIFHLETIQSLIRSERKERETTRARRRRCDDDAIAVLERLKKGE